MTTPTREDEPRLSITRVWARNFKSIRELDLELGPLTVLVGPNASGKSNVLDVLRFISHALRRSLDAAVASRGGIGAIRRATPTRGVRDVEVGISVEKGRFKMDYGFVLGSRAGGFYHVKREYGVVASEDLEEKREFEVRDGSLVEPDGANVEQFETSELALPSLRRILFPSGTSTTVRRSRNFKTRRKVIRTDRVNPVYRAVLDVERSISEIKLYHPLPDVMQKPRPPRDTRLLNESGSNLASILREMIRRKSPYLGEIKGALGHVVPGLDDFQVQQPGGFLIVKLVHRTESGGRGALFDLSQESDGTVRLLGLLTALYQESPPLMIGIEEPELTLHPGALAVLAEVIVEAGLRTQVIVTTHSPDLIDMLPLDSMRAVAVENGCTKVGPVSETQTETVREGLFTSGELHSMEGLEPRA